MTGQPMRSEVEPWWRQAQADLETARQMIPISRHYAASWFAQQAVEKGLKALYLERTVTLPPRTHDLEYLGRQVQAPPYITDDLVHLNPAFGMARYPDSVGQHAPIDAISPSLAHEHLTAAERVCGGWTNNSVSSRITIETVC
ncbi:MAG TPA: hypothetical protein DCX80_05860 [Chloroflexi bacterium]|jgi:HEPN domain-containing protein|nr:hypothetical protein [Chloroflexota bacterium]